MYRNEIGVLIDLASPLLMYDMSHTLPLDLLNVFLILLLSILRIKLSIPFRSETLDLSDKDIHFLRAEEVAQQVGEVLIANHPVDIFTYLQSIGLQVRSFVVY